MEGKTFRPGKPRTVTVLCISAVQETVSKLLSTSFKEDKTRREFNGIERFSFTLF